MSDNSDLAKTNAAHLISWPLKVLIIGPHYSPIISRLVESLRSRGHEVWIASHDIVETKYQINLGELSSFFDYLKFYKINKLVSSIKPDVVHAHVVNHYGLMAAMQDKPLVIALWGSDVMLATTQGNFIKRLAFKLLNFIALRASTKCHTSGRHVAEEANKQFSGALKKTEVFYWGFPLDKPVDSELKKISMSLQSEFEIDSSERYVVFPRGLSPVYNPVLVARIIENLKHKIKTPKQIIVLKGFATEKDVGFFKNMLKIDEITFVNRLLTSAELYYLYSKTLVHVSVPLSDSLGGGVIEPALFGSFPVLSNLPSYLDYASQYPAHILISEDNCGIENTAEVISEKLIRNEINIAPKEFSEEIVIKKLEILYREAVVSLKH